jgi:hypothetical protein
LFFGKKSAPLFLIFPGYIFIWMGKIKILRKLYILLLLALLPCVLFSALVEFTRDLQEMDVYSSAISGRQTPESGGTVPLFSENLLLCGQPLTQNRSPLNKLWRQILSLIVFALLLKAFSKIALREYYLHNYFPRQFFHTLVTSLVLSGRAPPRAAY